MNHGKNTTHVLTVGPDTQTTLLRLVWEELGRLYPSDSNDSILIYGAGKFTKRLLRQVIAFPNGPRISGIADDNATPGQTMAGHRVSKPSQVTPASFKAVFLGTDYFEDKFAEQCKAAFGNECIILRYSNLAADVLEVQRTRKIVQDPGDIFHPNKGDPHMDISTVWQTAYGLMQHHECNDFKDNLLVAIAMNIKSANAERMTEYGFAMRHMESSHKQVLDIGSSNSAFPRVLADKGFEVTCLDPIANESKDRRIQSICGDIRGTDLPGSQFDFITCISTLEHIGLPGRYGITVKDPNGEMNAMREMLRLLKPGGKLILTIPFGQYAMLPLNRVYTRNRIMELKGHLNCVIEEYYCIDREGSYLPATAEEASESDLRLDCYYALGCFVFERLFEA